MPRKPKFKPVITRVKLNPEQAVLLCNCYAWSSRFDWVGVTGTIAQGGAVGTVCSGKGISSSGWRPGVNELYVVGGNTASS